MKRIYVLKDLDCANCAAMMENGIRKIDGVIDASVSFMAQKLIVEANDDRFDEIMNKVKKVCRRIEPDCKLIEKQQ